jgi:ubiquinone/menaquinone biosynthesis C-methylase UbiE
MSNIFPASAMPDPDWWQELWPHPAQTVALLGVRPGMCVVDLCCGDGLFTLPMAQLASKVVAIDLDPQMLKRMQAKLDAAGMRNCNVVEGNAYDVGKLAGMKADMVVMANTFHGVPDRTRLGQAVASALKPAGQFVVVNWHRRERKRRFSDNHEGRKQRCGWSGKTWRQLPRRLASILSPQSSCRPITTP